MKTCLVTLLSCLALSVLVPAPARANPEVERGVRILAEEMLRTWNARDIKGYMACFGQPEGLTIGGGSRYDLESKKARIEGQWNDRVSHSWTTDKVQVIAIDDRTALMQIVWSGHYTLKSGAVWEFKSSDFGTYLVRRIGNTWKIVASHESARGAQVNAAKKNQ